MQCKNDKSPKTDLDKYDPTVGVVRLDHDDMPGSASDTDAAFEFVQEERPIYANTYFVTDPIYKDLATLMRIGPDKHCFYDKETGAESMQQIDEMRKEYSALCGKLVKACLRVENCKQTVDNGLILLRLNTYFVQADAQGAEDLACEVFTWCTDEAAYKNAHITQGKVLTFHNSLATCVDMLNIVSRDMSGIMGHLHCGFMPGPLRDVKYQAPTCDFDKVFVRVLNFLLSVKSEVAYWSQVCDKVVKKIKTSRIRLASS